MKETTLERIEALLGTITAHDGRNCLWAGGRPYDVRDVAKRLKIDSGQVVDAMPIFARPNKRAKVALAETTEEDE